MTVFDDRMLAALEFAALTNRGGVQIWMRWQGWTQHVGCDRCAGDARGASCWGEASCHGYDNNCGCEICALQQIDDERQAVDLGALGAGFDLPVVRSLRAELAAIDAGLDPSIHRRAG